MASGGTTGQGPLGYNEDVGSSLSSAPVLPGQTFVTTVFTARLRGSRPAQLETVAPLDQHQAKGLRLRTAVDPRRSGFIGGERGWPPGGIELVPVTGFVVRPGAEAPILVGASARTLGHWRIDGFAVRYHVGSHRYRATFLQGLAIRVVRRCRGCR